MKHFWISLIPGQSPRKNRNGRRPAAFCAIAALALLLGSSLAASSAHAQDDIVFEGKFYSSVQRAVVLPYAGTIVELLVDSGQTVQEGDIILRYELDPETFSQIQQILNPIPIIDLNLDIIWLFKTPIIALTVSKLIPADLAIAEAYL